MEHEIKQLIELDVIAEQLKENYDKQIEIQIKGNTQQLENLKLQKEQEIKTALEELEKKYTEEINAEIEQKKHDREKIIRETEQVLAQGKKNIINFAMFNIMESFSSVK